MAVATAIDFKREVKELFELFDRQDFDKLKKRFSESPQGVDEISRSWMRGRAALDRYFEEFKEMGVSDIHTTVTDLSVKQWDDVAIVTCLANQSYKAEGETVEITAPTTALFRRVGNDWKIELIHAVALPEAA